MEDLELEEIDVGPGAPPDAFIAVYESEYPRMVRLAHLLTGSNDVAEDLAQDVMIRLRDRLPDVEQPAAYLTRSVTNACWNWHRSRRRTIARLPKLAGDVSVVAGPDFGDLLTLVDQLPFRQRTVLVGRYWLDLPDADIAELLGCRPSTVRTLAARAMRTMKGQLG